MPGASLLQSSFLGGEVSKFYQGRYDKQDYRSWLNVCLNYIPIEAGTLVRRPGFGFAGTTRGGLAGRTIKFDFQENAPYTMEFTDGHLRFWSGYNLATTNDSVTVSSISTANPAVATLSSAVTWATGDEGFFSLLGTSCPLLQNRRFTLTKVDTTHFSLADSITGATIDGSTLSVSGLAATATLNRVLDIATVYSAGDWANLRSVQTEIAAFFLHGNFAPYELTVSTQPIGSNFAAFSLAQSFFEDGPYLDPIPGSTITPGATSGIITLTAGLQAYSSTTAYTIGEYVVSGGIGYISLQDANVNNTPASSPLFWKVVSLGAPINAGQGFIASDIGRLVRLFSEPAAWASGTAYTTGQLVSYNPSGLPGGNVYYKCLTNNTGNTPGTDATNWQIIAIGSTQNPALWTWGKITSLSSTGAISGATGTNIGNMTFGGGLSSCFDGVTNKTSATDAGSGNSVTDSYVGKNYGGSPTAISQVVVYGSSDRGFFSPGANITINLRASNSLPSSGSNGTLLGTTGAFSNQPGTIKTITSTDTATTYQYVWVEITTSGGAECAQVTFYNASGAPGTGVNCEILGAPLLYSGVTITTWRLGVYSNTTGWPTCGTYAEGRLWLSGAVPNRIDACVANGINGVNNGNPIGSVNFAPTDQYGNVLASSGISYVFNAPDANPIFWMEPDLQGILCGTKAGEWLVQAPTSGGLAPTNIAARRVTRIGCANIEPRHTEHTLVFVQKFLRKIMEFFPDVFSGKFTAPHITEKSKHLTIGNIAEIAYQQELAPVVWARVNGALAGWTYKRDTLMTSQGPTFAGGHRHTLGSGRSIQSIAVGPSTGGNLDALTIVSLDAGTGIYHVEVLTDILDEGSLLSAASYLDDAVTPSSYTLAAASGLNVNGSITLNGLWHLNGKTVTAWMGGLDCGDYTVSNGSITVGFGDGIPNKQGSFPAAPNRNDEGLFTANFLSSGVTANGVTLFTGTMPMRVGFTYTSQGQIVRPAAPAESGARNGPAFGKMRRVHQAAIQIEGTQSISIGTAFDSTIIPANFLQLNQAAYTIDAQFSGTYWSPINDTYSRDGGMLSWQVTRPYIANVVAVGEYLETQDT